jgi:hypothetical protein
MALELKQQPGALVPAQSPIVFSVKDNTLVYTSSSFQYTADIFTWSGSISGSGSVPNYTLRKYPNATGSGIFDVSRFLVGGFATARAIDVAPLNTKYIYYKVNFNYVYNSGSTIISGSTLTASTTGSVNYHSYDGYYLTENNSFRDFNRSLNNTTSSFPLLTDSVNVTQSALITDPGTTNYYAGPLVNPTQSFTYTGIYTNGSTTSSITTYINSSPNNINNAFGFIYSYPGQAGFPLSTASLESYKISTGSLSMNVVIDCPTKYPSQRIVFRNRYDAREWLDLNLVSVQTVQGESKSYRPQLGDWNRNTLEYDSFAAQNQKYISDSYQILTLNTNYLPEQYNEIIKQLIVSDYIALYTVDPVQGATFVPLEIVTNSVQLKTGVVNKLIQYTFQFRKNNYKLIL